MLGSVIRLCNLDPNGYKGHSFRIGAATYAAEQGVSDDKIRHLGEWKSDAFKKYIRITSLGSVSFSECVRGCDVVACRGGTTSEPHF